MKRFASTLALCCTALLAGCGTGAPAGTAGATVQAWVTTGDQSRLLARAPDLAFGSQPAQALDIVVDAGQRYQTMVGFGASLTDASAWLIQQRMSAGQRQALLEELFGRGPQGLGFDFARLTIGASDFSRHHYSFDDMPRGQSDPGLTRFSIEPNRAELLPVLKAARAINPQLQVMASPWSAPGWMKTSDSLIQGALKPEMYGVYAEYLTRYVEAYAAEGVPIFALTLQNEPHFEPPDYPGMRLDPAARAALIGQHLGPLLRSRGLKTQLFDWDHNWDEPQAPLAVLADAQARSFVQGVAWHCYAGDVAAQGRVREAYPDKEVWFTECSGGEWAPRFEESLPWLTRNLIIGATRHWARGVLMWNLALDEQHGPHLGGCKDCRGVVSIDSKTGAVTRNIEYYAFGHASRFVRQGAQRIASSSGLDGLDSVAFRHADDGREVLIVCNSAAQPRRFSVSAQGQRFAYELPAASVATFVWQAPR
jgi:glucosylceramidase